MANHHLQFGEHLTEASSDKAIRETHLGQAHIAGTGPPGTTCRQCSKWLNADEDGELVDHKYRGHGKGVLFLQPAYCCHPILNKATRLVPPTANSCRLFFEAEKPPPLTRADKRRKKAAA